MSSRQGGFAGAGVATQIREALEWQQVQLALSPGSRGSPKSTPGVEPRTLEATTARLRPRRHDRASPPGRPRLGGRGPYASISRGPLRPGLSGSRNTAEETRHPTSREALALSTPPSPGPADGRSAGPTSWLQGAGPTPPVCFSARPPHWSSSGPCSGAYPAVNRKRGTAYVNQVSPHKGTAAGPWSRSSALALRGVRGPARSGAAGPQCTPVGCQHCPLNESRASRRVILGATL